MIFSELLFGRRDRLLDFAPIFVRFNIMSGEAGNNSSLHKNRWRVIGWGAAAIMLLLPLIAMQFTDEVDWDLSDFIIFGAMLAAAGGTFELATRVTSNKTHRAAVVLALAAAFILIWVNGAVGIIGN